VSNSAAALFSITTLNPSALQDGTLIREGVKRHGNITVKD
jgi:hypothetical protein